MIATPPTTSAAFWTNEIASSATLGAGRRLSRSLIRFDAEAMGRRGDLDELTTDNTSGGEGPGSVVGSPAGWRRRCRAGAAARWCVA